MKRNAEHQEFSSDNEVELSPQCASLSLTKGLESDFSDNADLTNHWNVPKFTADSMQYGATASSSEHTDQAYISLLDELASNDGGNDVNVNLFTSNNQRVYDMLRGLTCNTSYFRLHPSARAQRDAQYLLAFEVIMAWLFRLLSGRCWVLTIVMLSLWAWKSRVPKPFWGLLSRLRLLYTKATTEMIAKDLGYRALRQDRRSSGKVSLSVMDNCLVNFNTSFEGRQGEGNWAYLMVNWFTSPIPFEETKAPGLSSVSGIKKYGCVIKVVAVNVNIHKFAYFP